MINLSTAPGNRFFYRNHWVELFIKEDGLFEIYIELPHQDGVYTLEAVKERQKAIVKAKAWIDLNLDGLSQP